MNTNPFTKTKENLIILFIDDLNFLDKIIELITKLSSFNQNFLIFDLIGISEEVKMLFKDNSSKIINVENQFIGGRCFR